MKKVLQKNCSKNSICLQPKYLNKIAIGVNMAPGNGRQPLLPGLQRLGTVQCNLQMAPMVPKRAICGKAFIPVQTLLSHLPVVQKQTLMTKDHLLEGHSRPHIAYEQGHLVCNLHSRTEVGLNYSSSHFQNETPLQCKSPMAQRSMGRILTTLYLFHDWKCHSLKHLQISQLATCPELVNSCSQEVSLVWMVFEMEPRITTTEEIKSIV